MEEVEETKEIVTDTRAVDKQFKYFNEKLRTRKGALQNDELDLTPIETVIIRSSVISRDDGSVR